MIYVGGANKRLLKEAIIGEQLHMRNGETYTIQEGDIAELSNVIKKENKELGITIKSTEGDILLKTETFVARGTAGLEAYMGEESVYLNLEYTPCVGISESIVRKDFENRFTYIESVKDSVSYYEQTVEQVLITDNLEEGTSRAVVDVILKNDLCLLKGSIMMDYAYDRGGWNLVELSQSEFDIAYLEGKNLEFKLDDFVNTYSEGQLFVITAGETNIVPYLTKDMLTVLKEESVGLYEKNIVLAFEDKTPFYSVSGEIEITYRYETDAWRICKCIVSPTYTFDLIGNYEGWYVTYGQRLDKQNQAALEITSVNNEQGTYEGIFTYTLPSEESQALDVTGKYYVTGTYKPSSNRDSKGDTWYMSGKMWIEQPKNHMMIGFIGNVDMDTRTYKGSGAYGNTFELKRKE